MATTVPSRLRSFARSMRKDATKAELALWQAVRSKKLEGLKFKRQVPLGPYIVDFVCLDRKLIIEVDGGQHCEASADVARYRYAKDRGYRTLRFWNNEVLENLDGVIAEILHAIER